VLRFVDDPDLAEARLALTAIRRASVGVYERRGVAEDWSRAQLMTDADLAMSRRGWTRIVGVADGHEAILVYVPAAPEPDRICLSVVTDRELVVVSATLNPDALVELIKRHGEKDFRKALARLN
jgi:purine nucleoside phosphorylase